MNLSGKKILITGANGFIGINLINKLKKYHKNVYALVEPRTDVNLIKNIKHKFIDITNNHEVKNYVLEVNPDIIIHLAAYINNETSQKNVLKSTKINVGGTLNLLDAASFLEVKPFFVFISTGEVYGNLIKDSFKEYDMPKPGSVYSITKFAAEDLCEKYKSVFDVPVLIVRPSVIYGPFQKEGMFIPSIILSLLKGKNFDMTKGEQLRDFIYAEDFIEAFIGLMKNKSEGIFNISSGKSYSIKKIALNIKNIIKTKAKLNLGNIPYRENEIWRYKLDNTKLKKDIKWSPEYTVEEGIKKTIRWYKNNIRGKYV